MDRSILTYNTSLTHCIVVYLDSFIKKAGIVTVERDKNVKNSCLTATETTKEREYHMSNSKSNVRHYCYDIIVTLT